MIRGKFLCVRVLVLMAVAALSVYAQSSGVVVSSAGNVSAVAPGSLATMWGVQLGTGPLQAGSQAATDLGGFSVEVSGVPAQLLFVSSGQINFIVPSGTALGNAAVTVKSAGQVVGQGNATVLMLAPAIFVSNQAGVQMGAMLNAVTMTGDPFGPNTPSIFGCDKRTRIAVFGTGLGLSVPRVSAQDIQVEAQDSTGAIFSFPAESAGPAFGFTGLDQVNVTVPVGMAPGRVSMRLVAGGSASNQASFDLTAGGGVPASAACLAGIAAQAIPGVSTSAQPSMQFAGTVSLAYPAPQEGAVVNLGATADASMPPTLQIPAGLLSAQFQASVTTSSAPHTLQFTASLNGDVRVATVDLSNLGLLPCVASVKLNANAVAAGGGVSGTVMLTAPAPAGGMVVNLSSTNPSVTVASQVTVPAGQISAGFTVSTAAGSGAAQATILATTGSCAGVTAAVAVIVSPPVPCVAGVSISAGGLVSGGTTTGTVTLTAPAPAGGLVVNLVSDNPNVKVDGQVTVPAGQSSANFTVTAALGGASAPLATITASVGPCAGASLAVTVGLPQICISSLSVSADVMSGGSFQGTVTLTAPAPSGGLVVNLASGNPGVSVTSSVTVPAGQTSANFTASSSGGVAGQATITASVASCSGASVTLSAPVINVSMLP
jgi:uncharacterized protein (TIGR03437 family)